MGKDFRTRRHRRLDRARLRSGAKIVTHQAQSGRTGRVHTKKLGAVSNKSSGYKSIWKINENGVYMKVSHVEDVARIIEFWCSRHERWAPEISYLKRGDYWFWQVQFYNQPNVPQYVAAMSLKSVLAEAEKGMQ